jgi:DNA-binding beta-propeller fold protein YncE
MFQVDPAWPTIPNGWSLGQVSSAAADSNDHIWVLHRSRTIRTGQRTGPPVMEFDAAGRYVQGWGGPGDGYEWPRSEHGVYVDYKGFVWIGGNGEEDQILKFTRAGKFVMQIGHSGAKKTNADTRNLWKPADVFVYPKTNELFVADGYFNHRVVVFDAETGKFKRAWGAYGKKPDDSYKFPPRAQLIQGDPPPQFNNPVHAALVSGDDLVYVADRTNNRLQIFKVDGTFVKEVFVARNTLQQEGTVYNFVFSPDKEQRFLYVMDGSNKAIRVYDRKSMELLESIGGHAGHNAREFFHPHSFAVDSKGNLFIGEVNDGQRYYRYAFKGMRSVNSTQ